MQRIVRCSLFGLALTGLAGAPLTANAETDSPLAYEGKNFPAPVSTVQQAVTTGAGEMNRELRVFDYNAQDAFGNSRWGAGYNLTASSASLQYENGTKVTRYNAAARTWARVFEKTHEVASINADALLAATTNGDGGSIGYEIYLLGNKVSEKRFPTGRYTTEFTLFNATQAVTPEATAQFTVAFIPVYVSASVHANEYAKLHGDFLASVVSGRLKPGAKLYVKARAAAGVSGFGAGVSGNLSLLSVEAPIDAKVQYHETPLNDGSGKCIAQVSADGSVGLGISSLSGKLDVFVDLFTSTPSKTIAKWSSAVTWHPLLPRTATVTRTFGPIPCVNFVPYFSTDRKSVV